jgi:hypothetical protein
MAGETVGLNLPALTAMSVLRIHGEQGHVPFIAAEPRLSSIAEESDLSDEHRLDKQFNDRWRTLLSVDDLVSAVVETLETTGLSENTYLFYSSE